MAELPSDPGVTMEQAIAEEVHRRAQNTGLCTVQGLGWDDTCSDKWPTTPDRWCDWCLAMGSASALTGRHLTSDPGVTPLDQADELRKIQKLAKVLKLEDVITSATEHSEALTRLRLFEIIATLRIEIERLRQALAVSPSPLTYGKCIWCDGDLSSQPAMPGGDFISSCGRAIHYRCIRQLSDVLRDLDAQAALAVRQPPQEK